MEIFKNLQEKKQVLRIIQKSIDIITILREFEESDEIRILKQKLSHTCSGETSHHSCFKEKYHKFAHLRPSELTETQKALHSLMSSETSMLSLLPELLDYLCLRLHNILSQAGKTKAQLQKRELKFLMSQVVKMGTTSFFQNRLRKALRQQERLYTHSQQLIANPSVGVPLWQNRLSGEPLARFLGRNYHLLESLLDWQVLSAELTLLEKLGKFEVESADRKHTDVIPDEVHAADFPLLNKLGKQLVLLPNFLNYQLSRLVFIVSQFFRVSWFRGASFADVICEHFSGTSARSRCVSLLMFVPYAQQKRTGLEVSVNDDRVLLTGGNALLLKSRKTRLSSPQFKPTAPSKGFVLVLSLCANPEASELAGF